MTNEDDRPNPYGTTTNENKAKKLKNLLKGLYTTLERQQKGADKQVTVALELKTDLHIQRVLERFAEVAATMDKVTGNVADLELQLQDEVKGAQINYVSRNKVHCTDFGLMSKKGKTLYCWAFSKNFSFLFS